MRLKTQIDDRLLQRGQHAEVPTARAPIWINLALQFFDGELGALRTPLDLSQCSGFDIDHWDTHFCLSLNHDLMNRHVFFSLASQNPLHAVHNVVGKKWFSVIFSDMAIGDDGGLGSEIV